MKPDVSENEKELYDKAESQEDNSHAASQLLETVYIEKYFRCYITKLFLYIQVIH